MPTRQEVMDYIIRSAQSRGIDPNTALRVFRGESSFNPAAKLITPREASYGVTQLNIKNGLGVDALRKGIDPRDVNQWRETIDFSLDNVKRGGWTPWSAAKKAGVGRWDGVDSTRLSNPPRPPADIPNRPPKNIDIGATPTLANLNPPKPKPTTNLADSGQAAILKQITPTDQVSTMARHPGFDEAIKRSMTGNTENVQMEGANSIPPDIDIRGKVRMAGFVPPGLTRGATSTRRAANAGVQPKGTIKDVEGGAKRSRELKDQPDVGKQKGEAPDDVKRDISAWNEAHEKWLNGDGPNPGPPPTVKPNVRSATDPAGAADFRQGTALQRTDPNLAAQNDPAAQAMIAAKITGRAIPGSGGAPPTSGLSKGDKIAATAGGAAAGTAAGLATRPGEDPALAAVQQQMQAQQPNIDPGTAKMLAAQEQRAGLPPGTLSGGNAGWKTSVMGPMINEALPVFQEIMRDPETRPAVMKVVQKAIQTKAQRDAMRADVQADPAYYQRMASQRQPQQMPNDPNNPLAERQMMDAVTRDTQGVMRNRGNAATRPISQAEFMPQVVPPGAEKGDIPPQVAQMPQPVSPQSPQVQQNMGLNNPNPYPQTAQLPYGSFDQSGGVGGVRSAGQMPNDPVMQQLMQFFTGGGGE